MKVKRDKIIEAIAKIIELTRANILRWNAVNSSAVKEKNSNDIISSVFSTPYKEKILRIFKRKYLSHYQGSIDWFEEVVLEIVDDNGNSLWTFPKEAIINDLLQTIQFKISGADDLMNSLLNEQHLESQPGNYI